MPDTQRPLRDDIDLLGRMLGDVIRELEGAPGVDERPLGIAGLLVDPRRGGVDLGIVARRGEGRHLGMGTAAQRVVALAHELRDEAERQAFASELERSTRPLVIFSIADCLRTFLPADFEVFYSDGHLTCFKPA